MITINIGNCNITVTDVRYFRDSFSKLWTPEVVRSNTLIAHWMLSSQRQYPIQYRIIGLNFVAISITMRFFMNMHLKSRRQNLDNKDNWANFGPASHLSAQHRPTNLVIWKWCPFWTSVNVLIVAIMVVWPRQPYKLSGAKRDFVSVTAEW